jgi:hypothetical protein
MKRISLTKSSAVALVALSALTSAHGEELTSYGRAGGPVGIDRIRYIVASPESASPKQALDYPGIAGGPVGADRIRHIVVTAKSARTDLAAYPGIAGGPVGADRISWLFNRDRAKTPTVVVKSNPTK